MNPFVILLVIMSCTTLLAQQGISGKVEWISGNQMPGPDRVASPAKGIKREVLIHRCTALSQVNANGVFFSDIQTPLIAKVKSNKKGNFKLKLPEGEYSLFIKEKQGLFANRFDDKCRINYVSVKPGKFTEITILVDYEAAY
ncbi:MAG: carboxypeptidase regulatory-like domain-containing protein [Cyclobacteriaceae bacterium]|nr:carboxypeptidase regulatory-like domain-containing protein [Cyclobacteriaceae bacterium]